MTANNLYVLRLELATGSVASYVGEFGEVSRLEQTAILAMKHESCKTVTLRTGTYNGRYIVRVWSEPYLPREGQA